MLAGSGRHGDTGDGPDIGIGHEATTSSGSLHHPSCGCAGTLGDADADADAAAAAAAAQVSDALLSNHVQLRRIRETARTAPGQVIGTPPRMRVAVVLPHARITGGLKLLVAHVRLLREHGHHVVAVTRAPPGSVDHAHAMPEWSGVAADEDVVLSHEQHLADVYPNVGRLDVVLVGMFHQVPELLLGLPPDVPLLYFEQGHEWLFGDPVRHARAHGMAAADKLFHMAMGLPVGLAAVSNHAAGVLSQQFGRSVVLVVPGGVDTVAFQPRCTTPTPGGGTASASASSGHAGMGGVAVTPPAPTCGMSAQPGSATPPSAWPWLCAGLPPPDAVVGDVPPQRHTAVTRSTGDGSAGGGMARPRVLLVGDPLLKLKGFDVAVDALLRAAEHLQQQPQPQPHGGGASTDAGAPPHPLLVTWVCQRPPPRELLHAPLQRSRSRVAVALYVSPAQALLPQLYAAHDALLFASHYEAFGLPLLEAMAAGVAVVATDCGGPSAFAAHGVDCLLSPPGQPEPLARHLAAVLCSHELRSALASAGTATAARHSLEASGRQMEELLMAAAGAGRELASLRSHPMVVSAALRACEQAIQAGAAVFPLDRVRAGQAHDSMTPPS